MQVKQLEEKERVNNCEMQVKVTLTWYEASAEKNKTITAVGKWFLSSEITESKVDALHYLKAIKPLSSFGKLGLQSLMDEMRTFDKSLIYAPMITLVQGENEWLLV